MMTSVISVTKRDFTLLLPTSRELPSLFVTCLYDVRWRHSRQCQNDVTNVTMTWQLSCYLEEWRWTSSKFVFSKLPKVSGTYTSQPRRTIQYKAQIVGLYSRRRLLNSPWNHAVCRGSRWSRPFCLAHSSSTCKGNAPLTFDFSWFWTLLVAPHPDILDARLVLSYWPAGFIK